MQNLMSSRWFPFLVALVSAAVGTAAGSTMLEPELTGFLGCAIWAIGSSGAGVSCARRHPIEIWLTFVGVLLVYLAAVATGLRTPVSFGPLLIVYLVLALTAPVGAFWLGVAAGRCGVGPGEPRLDNGVITTLVWAGVAGLQVAPVALLFAAVLFRGNGQTSLGAVSGRVLRVEAFAFLFAIYAVAPWLHAAGMRPARYRRLIAVSNAVGILCVFTVWVIAASLMYGAR